LITHTDEVKDINQSDNARGQRLHGVVSLVASRLALARVQIVGFFVPVLENSKDNSLRYKV
jgi:hypothetical protein